MITGSARAAAVLASQSVPYNLRATSVLGTSSPTILADDIPFVTAVEDGSDTRNVPTKVTLTLPREADGFDWDPAGDDTHPLAAAGQKLSLVSLVDGEPIVRGLYVISDAEVLGDTVTVTAGDMLYFVSEAPLLVPFAPTGTLKSMLRAMMEPALTVNFDAGLADRSVPAGLNIDDSRIDAINQLLKAWPAEMTIDQTGVAYVSRPRTMAGLWVPGTADAISTPDHASLDLTGDMDIAVDCALASWANGFNQVLVCKYSFQVANQSSYNFFVASDGKLWLVTSPNGDSANQVVNVSSVAVGATPGQRLSVRVDFDANDGAGHRVTRFYTGPSVDGPWTQLGTTQTNTPNTSVFSGNRPLTVGSFEAGGGTGAVGTFYAAKIKSSSGGTVVAAPDFEHQPSTVTTSFTDSTGKVWTTFGAAYIVPVLAAGMTFEESRGGTVIRTNGKSSRDGVWTAVVASGTTSSGTPVSAVAYRTGVKGYPGNFNPLPVAYKFDSDLLTTIEQCQQAAIAQMYVLSRKTGRRLTIEAIPDPRVQLGDIVQINSRKYTGIAQVVAYSLPLCAWGGMPAMDLEVVTLDG